MQSVSAPAHCDVIGCHGQAVYALKAAIESGDESLCPRCYQQLLVDRPDMAEYYGPTQAGFGCAVAIDVPAATICENEER